MVLGAGSQALGEIDDGGNQGAFGVLEIDACRLLFPLLVYPWGRGVDPDDVLGAQEENRGAVTFGMRVRGKAQGAWTDA